MIVPSDFLVKEQFAVLVCAEYPKSSALKLLPPLLLNFVVSAYFPLPYTAPILFNSFIQLLNMLEGMLIMQLLSLHLEAELLLVR